MRNGTSNTEMWVFDLRWVVWALEIIAFWIRYNPQNGITDIPQNNEKEACNIECLDTKTIFALLLNFNERYIDVYKEDGSRKIKKICSSIPKILSS